VSNVQGEALNAMINIGSDPQPSRGRSVTDSTATDNPRQNTTFSSNGGQAHGYLALPAAGSGPGVIVIQEWWGLTDHIVDITDRLAREGFVALAPDLYRGRTATTIAEAEALLDTLTVAEGIAILTGAVAHLRSHPATRGDKIGVMGFSMGANWALNLSTRMTENLAAVVLFYGSEEADFSTARAAYLGHFAEEDEWEPDERVRDMELQMRAAGREVTFHRYPGTGHWFFEQNRPDAYDAAAASLAWERTLAFLRSHLMAH
jgi:carboxymethylenebutenolidase